MDVLPGCLSGGCFGMASLKKLVCGGAVVAVNGQVLLDISEVLSWIKWFCESGQAKL